MANKIKKWMSDKTNSAMVKVIIGLFFICLPDIIRAIQQAG